MVSGITTRTSVGQVLSLLSSEQSKVILWFFFPLHPLTLLLTKICSPKCCCLPPWFNLAPLWILQQHCLGPLLAIPYKVVQSTANSKVMVNRKEFSWSIRQRDDSLMTWIYTEHCFSQLLHRSSIFVWGGKKVKPMETDYAKKTHLCFDLCHLCSAKHFVIEQLVKMLCKCLYKCLYEWLYEWLCLWHCLSCNKFHFMSI